MGQEIGISPLQLVDLVSTIANDGIWVAPRIVAGTMQPQSTPQTIAFQPSETRRVISTMTAAEMRQMLQGVVLHGTGRKAILEGYSSAGKTGTAQKVDPATGAYSKTKYVGSFAGFAPVNNPQIAVAVILDSAVGLHQGGQVAAPVFQRVMQQTLEYLHVPHDVELPPSRQVLLARRNAGDLDESSPDHFGAGLEEADNAPSAAPASPPKPAPSVPQLEPAAMARVEQKPPISTTPTITANQEPAKSSTNGTVVLDVEEGGIEVPSFIGKSVRAALEVAEDTGLDLDAIGSGLALDQ
jgi:cell division protein FtsI (penicillin-binding protein 3)